MNEFKLGGRITKIEIIEGSAQKVVFVRYREGKYNDPEDNKVFIREVPLFLDDITEKQLQEAGISICVDERITFTGGIHPAQSGRPELWIADAEDYVTDINTDRIYGINSGTIIGYAGSFEEIIHPDKRYKLFNLHLKSPGFIRIKMPSAFFTNFFEKLDARDKCRFELAFQGVFEDGKQTFVCSAQGAKILN